MKVRLTAVFCLIALLVIALLGGAHSTASQPLQPPPPFQVVSNETEGATLAEPTLTVVASDATLVDLTADIPGCLATEIEVAGQTYTRLSGRGFGFGTQIGLPDLPVLRRGVEIPFGAELDLALLHADVFEYDLEALGIHQPIYPLQPPRSKEPGTQEDQPFVIDADFYQTDTFYPAQPLAVTQEYIVRGHRVVMVEVWPLAYNPATGKIRLYSNVRFRLQLTGSDMQKTTSLAQRYASPAFESRLAGQILNYNQSQPGFYNLDSGPGYLIIVADAYYNNMTSFRDLKTSQGFQVTMTRLSDIPGSGSNSDIKAYIQDAYDNWTTPPSYVLLVGDTNTIPGWNSVSAGEITDLYYATMDGSSDWVPDIVRGRFPVRSTAQTDIMVNKYLAYDNLSGSEAWLQEAAFIGTCDSGYYQVAEGTHNYVINNHTGPAGYTGDFPNSNQYGGDKLYCITYGADTSDVRAALNNGRWVAIYSGHGSNYSWAGPTFTQSDVQSLTSTGVLPFVAGFACITGDFALTECFGETWVLQDNKGALLYLGSSDSSYWDEDDTLERSMFDALFDDPQPSVGDAVYAGLTAVQQQHSMDQYYWETYNIFGDPAVKLNMGGEPGPTPTPTATVPTPTPTVTPTPAPVAPILLVDDDTGSSYESYYTAALNALGKSYDTWNVQSQGSPSAATLQQYDVVIWFTGDDYTTTLTSTDQANLTTYLNGGGRLFITGQDIGYDINSSSFYGSYLHASYVLDDTNTYGLTGYDILSGVNVNISGGDGANNQNWPSEIGLGSGAVGLYDYDGSYGWGGLRWEGTYKVVYFSFGYEAINAAASRNSVMNAVLSWLEGGAPPPTPTPTSPPGGEVFADDFETNKGWTVNPYGTDTATTGMWERANPEETTYGGLIYQLGTTHSGSYDLVTGPLAGSSVGSYDIDSGVTTIRSPNISLPGSGNLTLSFYYYLSHLSNSGSDDFLRVKVVGSTTQTVFEELGSADNDAAAWAYYSTSLNSFAGQTVYLLIEAADAGTASLVEAAVDDVSITSN